ncbi:DUF6524 family protein [Primorskyibacter sp. S187A]|uniref:DUF6524 family protein n=1 Tax=Primorskyibacter sp. S187A TaxID=3415130 RepID=UPI003C7DA3F4
MAGFLLRWVFALVLVAATFNPTPYNYVTWAAAPDTPVSFIALGGLVLLIGYIIYLRATLRSIGAFGMLLVLALLGALLWVLYDLGWLSLENRNVNTWIGILAMSLVLGIGLSWSIVRRRLSGQADVDDVDA